MSTSLPSDNRVLFHTRDRVAFGWLSNFHPSPIVMDGVEWATVEHYYQAQKSENPDYQAAVRQAPTPGRAKRIGSTAGGPIPQSRQSWFRRNGQEPRSDWEVNKVEVMRRAIRAKFRQHAELAAALLATGTAELVEDSSSDRFWGSGADGMGLNWLGRLLAEVRGELVDSRIEFG